MLIILRDVVMKVLKANNYVPQNITECEVVMFPVKDIIITAPRKWIAKKMKPFTESIESVGMMWPVIVVHLNDYWEPMKSKRWPRKNLEGDFVEGYGVHTGNKRVIWAQENDYDFIEAYIVKSKEEKDAIVTHTFLPRGQWPGQVSK
tara:strand:- start:72 stop:512 length:441 start_codon:yes stop_codon:yes gene_type:complete